MKRIFIIKIQGQISASLVEKIANKLRWSIYSPQLLAVRINSPGGSITQAKQLSAILKSYSKEKDIPMYCFGEDQVLNAAMIPLTSGNKVYVNPYSLIGDLGSTLRHVDLRENSKKYKYEYINYVSNAHKKIMDPYEQLSEADSKWAQKVVDARERDLVATIEKNRADHLIPKDYESRLKLYQGLQNAHAYEKEKLIDGLESLDYILDLRFSGVKIHYL